MNNATRHILWFAYLGVAVILIAPDRPEGLVGIGMLLGVWIWARWKR